MTRTIPLLRARALLSIPIVVYGISYLYLALYHQQAWLLDTVVHENGSLTLLESIFYASHFLGHLPSLTVIALLFTGACLSIVPLAGNPIQKTPYPLATVLVFFLGVSIFLSVALFGRDETWAFLAQQKQGTQVEHGGGSWMLHLPSTLTLFVLVPLYLYVCLKAFGKPIVWNTRGIFYLSLAACLILLFTFLFSDSLVGVLGQVWTGPRYLAHSVRELATFPLTYFPLPLYFMMRDLGAPQRPTASDRRLKHIVIVLGVLLPVVLAYQCYVPLKMGIGELAQKPEFAHGAKLSIPYLLASHYFEHFLDTIYFTLLTLLLWRLAPRQT